MKHLKLFFALFAMLALGVGNAWGEEYSLTPDKDQTGLNNTSYVTNLPEFTYNGVTWKMNQWNPSTLQIKTNQSSATSEWRFYNTTAMPGKITKVVIKFSALTVSSESKLMFLGGTKAVTETTGGTAGTWDSNTKTLTWTPGASDDFTYFAFYQDGKAASGTNKLATSDAIVVTYETSGSGSTEPAASLTAKPTTIDFGTVYKDATVDSKTVTVNFENLTGDVTYSGLSTPFTATGAISATGDQITISADASTIGEYSQTLTVASTADSKTAEVTVKMNVVAPFNGKKLDFDFVNHPTGWPVKDNASAGEYVYNLDDTDYTFKHSKSGDGVYVAGTSGTSGYLLIASGNTLGLPAIKGYKLVKVQGTLNNSGSPSTSASVSITDGTNPLSGGTALTWNTKGGVYTYSLSGTQTNTMYYLSVSNKNLQMITLVLYYEECEKYALTITEPAVGTGTLLVKDGENTLTSGAEIYEGTKLTVTATPETGYKDGVVVVKNASDEDVTAAVYDAGTLTMPAYAVTISATFEKKSCTPLATPANVVVVADYKSAILDWDDVTDANHYIVTIKNGEETVENNTVDVSEYEVVATLLASTTYTYEIQATADDAASHCPSALATGNFSTEALPTANLTLMENGNEVAGGSHSISVPFALPTEVTHTCGKTFVGWTSKSDFADGDESLPSYYEKGADFTFENTNPVTLYAVYADVVEGASVNVFSETFDACDGSGGNDNKWSGSIASGNLTLTGWTCANGAAANACAKFGGGSKKGSAETPAITLTGVATLTFRAAAWSGDGKTLNLSATGATLGKSSVTLKDAEWTEYTIVVTGATGSVKIKFEAQNASNNRFFLDDVVVSQASVTYSNYSTTCVAALDAPIFNPEAGTYNEVTNVTISATDGDVYYTLDGTTPTEESNKYTGPIVLNSNGTTTIKAIAISAESQSTVVSATYTIKLPLTTMDQIFAKATAVGSAATSVQVVMNNWVVTGATITNAYVTDGTKGFIIYRKDGHGFSVGNILSGTVSCKVQLYNGSAQLTELTSTTEGLTVSTGGVVTPEEVNDVTTLGGINTGSVIKINGVHTSDNIVNNVKLYNTLFSFTDLTVGQEYNITGVYLQYNATKEILPRIETDIEEVEGLPTATISIENITLVERDEHTIVATITPDEAASTVTYSIKSGSEYISLSGNVITANAVGIATITATIAEVDGVYHGTTKDFTVTVNEYVAPISGRWELVTDASKLQAGMEVIVAQYVKADGTIYTMGAQKTNNRASVESTVSGTALTPTTGTVVLTLADAGNGTFALQAGNGKYLYAASSSDNHLKEKDEIDVHGQWTIMIADSKATIKAEGSSNRNLMCYNSSSKLFSCYASNNPQQAIALYARVPDHIREVPVGYFATICVPNNIVKVVGATLYKVAGKKNGKLYFDEVLVEETVAGMPYVFFTDAATQEFYYGSETTDIAGKNKSLQGTFVRLVDGDLDGDYMLQSNKIIKCAPTGCWIDPYRAYFDGYDLSRLGEPSAQMPDRRRVSLGAEEENETTGTENIVAPEGQTLKLIENGQLIIIRGGVKFNAQGVRL